ncbi:SusC/RagA family TonB-linked outer membrane protein [Capnocytophaga sp.]|uniref:SusC/RagA family TonB-linked outer membrane protein n=1 Tax=Capnocytophaga sp. TaxID=44737 RepID=UPI0026DB4EA3|nr:SusC/RagA family TonB-linked outer membrane protein [Capnocytophaga sp.]MDO5105064.1 SusC/RagA family TonB-linked outer membrane protein [Capnocytophaga sp.]
MERKLLITFVLIAGFFTLASAQNRTVKGTVTDEAGIPLSGVSVVIKNTSQGVSTDFDGKYSLQTKQGDILVFSYVGFSTQEKKIAGGTQMLTLNVTLKEDTQQLGEIVVTALGIKRSEKALGYALQEVDGAKLLESRDANVTNALSGKVSGLQVVRGAGGLAGSSKIILRGQNSLTGDNQPLVVVDGVPIDNKASGAADIWGNSGMDMGNGLQDINPEDIESVSVLKGASAAALYGSRAGNGVILITTKSGKQQKGLGISVSSTLATEDIFVRPELQNSFAQGIDGTYDPKTTVNWGPKITGQTVTGWNGQPVTLAAYDNIGHFFRRGITATQAVTFQQQIEKTSVYASVNYMDNSSIVPETELNRTSVALRATSTLGESERWKIDFKINYVNTNANNRPIQGLNQSNVYKTLNIFPRTLDIREFNPPIVDGKQIWYDTQTLPDDNPWWTLKYNRNNDVRNRYISFGSLSYEFTDWLRGEIKAGLDYYNTKMYHRKHSGSLSVPKNGFYSEGSKEFSEKNLSFLFIAQKNDLFNTTNLSGNLTFGGNLMTQQTSEMSAHSGDLLLPDIFSLNNGKEKPVVNSLLTQRKMNSLYGSAQIGWKNSLYLDATFRNDWSSTMSKANRSYFYPSVSFSGIVSELMKMPEWITFVKLRASYAEVGNDLEPHMLYNSYSVNKDYWGTPIISTNKILYDSSVLSELIKSYEAGIDLRFFNNRLKLDAAVYQTNATRQLLQLPMDETSGYSFRIINAGNIENKGVEISLGAGILSNPNGLNWDASVNFSKNKNQIIDLYTDVNAYTLLTVDEITVLAEKGKEYGAIYGSKIRRVEDAQSPHYGKMILTAEGLPQRSQTALNYLGHQQPDFMLGVNNSFAWRGFNLDFMVDARVGGKIFSMTRNLLTGYGMAAETAPSGERESFVVDGVIANASGGYDVNAKAVSPQRYWGALAQNNIGITEANIYDATSVRLRTLSFGYNFDKKWLEPMRIQNLKLSLTANNLWLIHTGIPGIDPESVSGTGTNVTALEFGTPPTTRSFTFTISVGL